MQVNGFNEGSAISTIEIIEIINDCVRHSL
jgi:hypothetical protein